MCQLITAEEAGGKLTAAGGAWQEVLRATGWERGTLVPSLTVQLLFNGNECEAALMAPNMESQQGLGGGGGLLPREQFGDGLVLTTRRADEEEPRRQELVVAGQELGDGPGGARGRPLLSLAQLTAFIDGVHQQEERLLGGLHAQERQEDTSVDRWTDVTEHPVTNRRRTNQQRSQLCP